MQRPHHLCATILATVSLLLIVPSVVTGAPLMPAQAGGEIDEVIVLGDVAYLTEGASISVWQLSADGATAPVRVAATQPMPGNVRGLEIVGNYLFATWMTQAPYGELAVFSLTDPLSPVHELDFAYSTGSYLRPGDVVAIGNELLLTDPESGVYAINVSDPLNPTVDTTLYSYSLERLAITGDTMVGWGAGFIGFAVEIFNVTTPSTPTSVGYHSTWGNYINGAVSGNTLILVGDGFEVVSLADPTMPTSLATVPNWGTYIRSAVMDGDLAYLGDETGVHVWDLSTPSTPAAGAIVTAQADRTEAGVIRTIGRGAEALLFTGSGWGLALDLATPAAPTLEHTFDLPVGSDSTDVAELASGDVAGTDFYSGLRLSDADLGSLGRVDPAIFQGGYEGIAVAGTTAFMASWGYGLIIVDVSDPNAPSTLGSVEIPYPTAVDVNGTVVYVVSSTNGGVFYVVDISDPTAPFLRGTVQLNQGQDVLAHNGVVLVADNDGIDSGMRIIDASLPDAPIQLGAYGDCNRGQGVAARGELAFLACTDGSMHVVSITDPAFPTQVGIYTDPSVYMTGNTIAVDGSTVWFGHTSGVDLIDVTDPAQPMLIQRIELPASVRGLDVGPDGNGWVAASMSGVFRVEPVVFRDGFESGDLSVWDPPVE